VRPLRLRYLSGPRRGDELIFSGPRVRIGRSRDNALILAESDAPSSSARHAEAFVDGGVWWIHDSGSTNGTYVNGAKVERHALRAGDLLAFGDDQFSVRGSDRTVWLTAGAVAVLFGVVASVLYATRTRAALPYARIAAVAAQSVYAVAIESDDKRSIVGTAFAVDRDVLATNAHVANLLRERGALDSGEARTETPGARAFSASARETSERATADAPKRDRREGGQASGTVRALAIRGDTYEVGRITAVTVHPDWQAGSLRADAAVLRLERGATLVPLPLAGDAAFKRLQRGTPLVSFGFPAVSTDARRPRGRVSVDVVGDVRGEYVQAGLAIAPGTSGSPVFDDEGSVVALVAGGDFVKGADGRLLPSGSQANWAISVERIRELLRQPR
jgi:FHA domain/Trypsin-like peptidase domain